MNQIGWKDPRNGKLQYVAETDQSMYRYDPSRLDEGKRKRRIEDILEASRLETEVLKEVWDA